MPEVPRKQRHQLPVDAGPAGVDGELAAVRSFYSRVLSDPEELRAAAAGGGHFIAIEGEGDLGAVASSVAAGLCRHGLEVILSREPGGTPGAAAIGQLLGASARWDWGPATTLLLLAAQRLDHLQKTVIPALKEGVWVVCERYVGESIVQLGFGRGLGADVVLRLHHQTAGGFMPDLTFVVTGSVAASPDHGPDGRILEGYLALRELIGALPVAPEGPVRETAAIILDQIERHIGLPPLAPQGMGKAFRRPPDT